ncbi:MAG: hypothetical protein ACE5HX_16585 [bacterium]
MKPKTIALLAILALFLVILIQNISTIELNILFWPIWMPKLILILSSVFLGWLVGWFTHLAYRRGKLKKESVKQTAIIEEAPKSNKGKDASEKLETPAES